MPLLPLFTYYHLSLQLEKNEVSLKFQFYDRKQLIRRQETLLRSVTIRVTFKCRFRNALSIPEVWGQVLVTPPTIALSYCTWLGPSYPRGRPGLCSSCWFYLGSALAVGDIWGVKQQMRAKGFCSHCIV